MVIKLPASEANSFYVWLYTLSSIFQRQSPVKWHTYWIPFPNKHLVPSIWGLPAQPLLFHSQGYFSVPVEFLPPGCISRAALLVGLQAFPNYTACCAAKKPVLETVKPPPATLFPELEQVPRYSPTLRAAQTNKGALCSHRTACKICSEYCLPSYCKSRHKNRFSSSAAFPLPFFKLMQFLIFNEHCCYCNICISPIHTALSPQTEVVFATRNCSRFLGFHLWIYPLLKATKGTCMEITFFKQMKGRQESK